jgi:hypothetical protein
VWLPHHFLSPSTSDLHPHGLLKSWASSDSDEVKIVNEVGPCAFISTLCTHHPPSSVSVSKSMAPRLKPATSPRARWPVTPLRLPASCEASISRRRQVSQACVDCFSASSDNSSLQSLDNPDVEVFEVTVHPILILPFAHCSMIAETILLKAKKIVSLRP